MTGVLHWCGRPVTELTREELIEAATALYRLRERDREFSQVERDTWRALATASRER